MAEFEEKFLVINWKYLQDTGDALKDLHIGRLKRAIQQLEMDKLLPDNKYYICNEDEPYAKKVIDTILNGENNKANPVEAEVKPDNGGLDFTDKEIKHILGRPCFQFIGWSQAIRNLGYPLARKAEEEQSLGI